MENKVKLKPGKWLYWIGILAIVVGIIVAIVISAVSTMQLMNNKVTATVPGQTDLNLNKVGTYAVTYYYNPANSGKTPITNYSDYAGLKFTLTDKSNNSDVKINSIRSNVMDFTISTPGTYTLNATYNSGSGPSAVMMIVPAGQSVIGLAAIVVFLVFLVAGVLIIIMTAVKRKKNRARAE